MLWHRWNEVCTQKWNNEMKIYRKNEKLQKMKIYKKSLPHYNIVNLSFFLRLYLFPLLIYSYSNSTVSSLTSANSNSSALPIGWFSNDCPQMTSIGECSLDEMGDDGVEWCGGAKTGDWKIRNRELYIQFASDILINSNYNFLSLLRNRNTVKIG